MEDGRLLSIRCPGQIYDKKKDELVKCNRLCVKVFPGSSGECLCPKCKLKFRFYVDSQARSNLAVRAKPVPPKE